MNITIVVITYNRPLSLKRLLGSISNADYSDKSIPLIISVDYQDSLEHSEVVNIAKNFEWNHGNKEVVVHSRNLGLRNHVISCGNLSKDYDAIIMLEDDIFVSPYFYHYVQEALVFYSDKDYVAGISLYTHKWNTNCDRPFIPLKNNYDTFFLQYAQSWGQCWTSKMWSDFYVWYQSNEKWERNDDEIPSTVLSWPNSSWLKYFIKYIIKTQKYFVYPYISLSTNFSEIGTHNKNNQNSYQVDLNMYPMDYKYPEIKEAIIYDSFYERNDNFSIALIPSSNICVDIYGTKKSKEGKNYWLTMQQASFKKEYSYKLALRPHELNAILCLSGDDIHLYNISRIENNNRGAGSISKWRIEIKKLFYDYNNLNIRKIVKSLFLQLWNKFSEKQ